MFWIFNGTHIRIYNDDHELTYEVDLSEFMKKNDVDFNTISIEQIANTYSFILSDVGFKFFIIDKEQIRVIVDSGYPSVLDEGRIITNVGDEDRSYVGIYDIQTLECTEFECSSITNSGYGMICSNNTILDPEGHVIREFDRDVTVTVLSSTKILLHRPSSLAIYDLETGEKISRPMYVDSLDILDMGFVIIENNQDEREFYDENFNSLLKTDRLDTGYISNGLVYHVQEVNNLTEEDMTEPLNYSTNVYVNGELTMTVYGRCVCFGIFKFDYCPL